MGSAAAPAAQLQTPNAADSSSLDSSKSYEDLVPISAWLGERTGAAESSPERELAGSHAEASLNGAASVPSPSQATPEGPFSSPAPERTSQTETGFSTSSTGTQQTPEEQAQAGGSQFQDIERERQRGSSGNDTGTYAGSQQFLSNGVSARGPADRDREPFAPGEGYQAAAPSATNGESHSS